MKIRSRKSIFYLNCRWRRDPNSGLVEVPDSYERLLLAQVKAGRLAKKDMEDMIVVPAEQEAPLTDPDPRAVAPPAKKAMGPDKIRS